MNMPADREKAADASLPTLVEDGSVCLRIRRTQAKGGSNSTTGGGWAAVAAAAAALVVVVAAVLTLALATFSLEASVVDTAAGFVASSIRSDSSAVGAVPGLGASGAWAAEAATSEELMVVKF